MKESNRPAKVTPSDINDKLLARGLPHITVDASTYKNTTTPAKFVCSIHNTEFFLNPERSYTGLVCPDCSTDRRRANRTMSLEAFEEKLSKVHSNYAVVSYTRASSPVTIKCVTHNSEHTALGTTLLQGARAACCVKHCRVKGVDPLSRPPRSTDTHFGVCDLHGPWSRTVKEVKKGQGCQKCGRASTAEKLAMPYSTFVSKAVSKHGDLFKYLPSADWVGGKSVVKIVCKIHGEFSQQASVHLAAKHGCPKCGNAAGGEKIRTTFQEFVEAAEILHKGKYTYSEVTYTKASEPVGIVCPTHGEFYQIGSQHLDGYGCRECSGGVSKEETQLLARLRRIYKGPVERNKRFGGVEFDMVFPELGVAVEYDGLYWHSSKFPRRQSISTKQAAAAAQGIRLINIFSDEFLHRRHAVLHTLRHALGLGTRVCSARQCEVAEVAQAEANKFLTRYHLQGGRNARYFGLMYLGRLVAVMGMSKAKSGRTAPAVGEYELVRFAVAGGVPGAAGKLLTHAIKALGDVKKVVSFSDNRVFDGDVYKRLGFTLVERISPSYWYVTSGYSVRMPKTKFQRKYLPSRLKTFDPNKSERENCFDNGYYQVFDGGKKRWELTL